MSLFSRNVDLGPPLRTSAWRKVAIGTWRTAGDPSVYGMIELDAEPMLRYMDATRAREGNRITVTHFVGKAIAETIRRHPDINCILRWGKPYPRRSIDIFFQVASDSTGEDLSGTTIRAADQKSMVDIAREMEDRVQKIRTRQDTTYKKSKAMIGAMPGMLARWLLDFTGFVMYTLNLWSPLLGAPKDSFGSVMVTNIGSLGLDMALAPLVPYSRVPILIVVGAVKEGPIVREGQLAVAKLLRLYVTIDHRLIDGMHASHMARTLQAIFADPEKELGPRR